MINVRKPDFLVCGGQRCGTTFLATSLNLRQDIHLATPMKPEPKFFTQRITDKRLEQYCKKYFPSDLKAKVVGEKSTSYLDVASVPNRLNETVPNVKLIFSLRHPVERAISNYFFSVNNGFEELSFSEAIQKEESRIAETSHPTSVHPNAYTERGMYANRLKRFYELFDKKQVTVILFDDLISDSDQTLDSVIRFLGVSNKQNQIPHLQAINKTSPLTLHGQKDAVFELLDHYRESNAELAEMLGRNLDAWNMPSRKLLSLLAG